MSIEFEESVEAGAIGSDNDKPAGSGHALAIIVPTAIVRPPWHPRCSSRSCSPTPGKTRAAYAVVVRTHHVSAYVGVLGRRYRAPTVKRQAAQTSRKSITSIAKVGQVRL
jgi:hypothetical protein